MAETGMEGINDPCCQVLSVREVGLALAGWIQPSRGRSAITCSASMKSQAIA